LIPQLHPLPDGRFAAECHRCHQRSAVVPKFAEQSTWIELLKIGWRLLGYRGGAYAICPKCMKAGPPK